MHDLIIIGGGPAGAAAAIYAARREMKTMIISKDVGGQLVWASEIENYPGFKSINAFELIGKFQEQISALGVKITQEEVKSIEKTNQGFKLICPQKEYEAKTVILAMGLSPRKLDIPGEKEFSGKGVSYCANCDGPFYKNKTVAVVGGGNSALDAAEIMSKIANKVYLIHRRDEFKAFEALIKEVEARDNIEMILDSSPIEFLGDEALKQIKVKNLKTEEEKFLEVDGAFVEIGRLAHTSLVKDIVDRNRSEEILVNELCETKTPGLFAAGDVTQVAFKQISIAAGQGTIAALAAYQYLQTKKD
ncbi:MAG: thioredoxin-disulfide reductase [Candidatus Pacebacteria bacterium]|nr:thioredoxin-disulfide reductase [Candidatus Paceibacterota bacterium]